MSILGNKDKIQFVGNLAHKIPVKKLHTVTKPSYMFSCMKHELALFQKVPTEYGCMKDHTVSNHIYKKICDGNSGLTSRNPNFSFMFSTTNGS